MGLTTVLEVENAVFKVHRSFLTKYSTVIKDMFEVPQPGKQKEATDENPLVLTGDTAVGWALLLESYYERYLDAKRCSQSKRAHMIH